MATFQILRREGDMEPSPVLDTAGDVLLFESGAEANAEAKRMQDAARNEQLVAELSGTAGATARVVFFVKPFAVSDDVAWRMREIARFRTGQYEELPWANELWWREALDVRDDVKHHYAHVSADDKSKVAYTPTAGHGQSDRQVRISPAKYLIKYFGMSNHKAAEYAERMSAGVSELKWAYKADDIEHVYTHGPSSCMAHDKDNYSSPVHPVAVYGDSDYGLAYITDPDNDSRIVARALVYKEKNVYGRIYGAERLGMLLAQAGYEEGYRSNRMAGGKIRAIAVDKDDGVYVAPYFDGESYGALRKADDGTEYIEVGASGRIDLSRTDGLSKDWHDDNRFACANCGDSDDVDNMRTVNGDDWCGDCADRYAFYCEHCGEDSHTDNMAGSTTSDAVICDSCAENRYTRCGVCERYSDDMLGETADGTAVCNEHDGDYVQVEDVSHLVESDEAHSCSCCNASYTADGMLPGMEYCTVCEAAGYVVKVEYDYVERCQASECERCEEFALKEDIAGGMCPACADDTQEDMADVG